MDSTSRNGVENKSQPFHVHTSSILVVVRVSIHATTRLPVPYSNVEVLLTSREARQCVEQCTSL